MKEMKKETKRMEMSGCGDDDDDAVDFRFQ